MAGAIDVDIGSPQVKTIKSHLIHPDYVGVDQNTGLGNNFNDVCLLTLNSNLDFNDNVKKIALNTEDIPENTKCVVSGWGTLSVSYIYLLTYYSCLLNKRVLYT